MVRAQVEELILVVLQFFLFFLVLGFWHVHIVPARENWRG